MAALWLILFAVFAVLNWIAVEIKFKPLEYLAKPLTMLALIVWGWQASGYSGSLVWFGLGLIFSLAGDVFLLLPKEQFIAGLVSFLLAHVFYIIGFNTSMPPASLPAALVALVVLLAALPVVRTVTRALQAGGLARLRVPVLLYSLVISVMLLSALLTLVRPEWEAAPALAASAGACSFFLSDSVLAWNKFVTPLKHGRLITMVSYHLGQAGILLGAAAHFLG